MHPADQWAAETQQAETGPGCVKTPDEIRGWHCYAKSLEFDQVGMQNSLGNAEIDHQTISARRSKRFDTASAKSGRGSVSRKTVAIHVEGDVATSCRRKKPAGLAGEKWILRFSC